MSKQAAATFENGTDFLRFLSFIMVPFHLTVLIYKLCTNALNFLHAIFD
jgi:hypothetical protein